MAILRLDGDALRAVYQPVLARKGQATLLYGHSVIRAVYDNGVELPEGGKDIFPCDSL